MCGRYAMKVAVDDLELAIEQADLPLDDIKGAQRITPSLNLAPRSYNMVYCSPDKDKFVLEAMQWTLQPSYAKEPVKYPSFNTRGESLNPLKPAWRCAKTRRGIVFMNGYYEWQHHGKEKLPFYIHSSSQLLAVLVIWDTNQHFGEAPTYSILTTEAAPDLKYIHPRMPVVTSFDHAKRWVSGAWPEVLDIVRPMKGLNSYRVSQDVNRVGVDRPGLNERIDPKKDAKQVKEVKQEKSVKRERPVTEWFAPAKPAKRGSSARDPGPKKPKPG